MARPLLKCVSVLLIFAFINKLTNAFEILPKFEREPGDKLIFMQTKVTIPTVDFQIHLLEFNWRGNGSFTQVVIEANGVTVANVNRLPTNISFFDANVLHSLSKQLIVTLLVYGFDEITNDSHDNVIPVVI